MQLHFNSGDESTSEPYLETLNFQGENNAEVLNAGLIDHQPTRNSLDQWHGGRGVMVIVVGIEHDDILDETDCISHSTNTLEKGMNPIILPPAMGK